jgi:hypothetical protein
LLRYYAACRGCDEEWEARGESGVSDALRSVGDHVNKTGHTVAEQDRTWVDVSAASRAMRDNGEAA